jgi:hypothetical protein
MAHQEINRSLREEFYPPGISKQISTSAADFFQILCLSTADFANLMIIAICRHPLQIFKLGSL